MARAGCPASFSTDSDAGIAEIAAAYAIGISKALAFLDGNRRTDFVTAVTFPRLKGYVFCPDPIDGVRMIEALATGKVDETGVAEWPTARLKPI